VPKYVRPTIPVQTFRDASGQIIDYGDRWPDGDGPDDTYEVVSHPERFKPLHDVADALIRYLSDTYAVEVLDDADPARPTFRRGIVVPTERCVRLRPDDENAATLTFFFRSFPSIDVEAGLLSWDVFPSCGCDHCDETVEWAAEELEVYVFAVVGGGLRETLSTTPPESTIEIRTTDGEHAGTSWSLQSRLSRDEARQVRARLAEVNGPWAAWPARG
jgi:hypothetical protein